MLNLHIKIKQVMRAVKRNCNNGCKFCQCLIPACLSVCPSRSLSLSTDLYLPTNVL